MEPSVPTRCAGADGVMATILMDRIVEELVNVSKEWRCLHMVSSFFIITTLIFHSRLKPHSHVPQIFGQYDYPGDCFHAFFRQLAKEGIVFSGCPAMSPCVHDLVLNTVSFILQFAVSQNLQIYKEELTRF